MREMRVPASAEFSHVRDVAAGGPVREDEQHVLTLWGEFKRRLGFAVTAEREREHARRFAAGDDAVHAEARIVVVLVVLRRDFVRREIFVTKSQPYFASDAL